VRFLRFAALKSRCKMAAKNVINSLSYLYHNPALVHMFAKHHGWTEEEVERWDDLIENHTFDEFLDVVKKSPLWEQLLAVDSNQIPLPKLSNKSELLKLKKADAEFSKKSKRLVKKNISMNDFIAKVKKL